MGDAAPWIVSTTISLAVVFVSLLKTTIDVSEARSKHGACVGRLTVSATSFDLRRKTVEFVVENIGGSPVFGVAGRVEALIDGKAVGCDIAGVDRILPEQKVLFRGVELVFSHKSVRRFAKLGRDRDRVRLRLTYFDHADARRIENRSFRKDGGGELMGFRVRRAFTSFG